jgi:hypothetical protein
MISQLIALQGRIAEAIELLRQLQPFLSPPRLDHEPAGIVPTPANGSAPPGEPALDTGKAPRRPGRPKLTVEEKRLRQAGYQRQRRAAKKAAEIDSEVLPDQVARPSFVREPENPRVSAALALPAI